MIRPPAVPYLSEDEIERAAMGALAGWERESGWRMAAPVPIEAIVEQHLGLVLAFDDLHARHGLPRPDPRETQILGAICFADRTVMIDQTLDPDERPEQEARFRFTLAHEGVGHWLLHRHLVATDDRQATLFEGPSAPAILCRTTDAKLPVEWQADACAAAVLMPRQLVTDAWREQFGNMAPRRPKQARSVSGPAIGWRGLDVAPEDGLRALARQFGVSMTALCIRLERLGLLRSAPPRQGELAGLT